MRIDLADEMNLSSEELADIDTRGAWFLTHQMREHLLDDPPMWNASQLRDKDEGETLGPKFLELFPERPVVIVGFRRGSDGERPHVIIFAPDGSEGTGLTDDDIQQAGVSTRVGYYRLVDQATRMRNAVVGGEQAKVPPPLPTGPDLDDHLYRDKVIPVPGTPAAERAYDRGIAGAKQIGMQLGHTPPFPNPGLIGGEGGGG